MWPGGRATSSWVWADPRSPRSGRIGPARICRRLPVCSRKGRLAAAGGEAAILAYGPIVHEAVKACEELAKNHEIRAAVVNFASIKPLDIAAMVEAAKTGLIVTAEDHHIDTGLGSLVAAIMAEIHCPAGSCGLV